MKCPKCGTETRMTVSLYLDIPSSMSHQLSKANLRRKEVHVQGAGWPDATYYCTRMCGWIDRPIAVQKKGQGS